MKKRGQGQGVGGSKQGDGGSNKCICPKCGATSSHTKGTPCSGMKCSKCGTTMVGEEKKQEIVENIKFDFTPECNIKEGTGTGKQWVELGGVALVEGVSKNQNKYTFNNLKENDGRQFKWLFGHPDEPEQHVVGAGALKLEGDKLMHTGKIRNTAIHPDVVESIKDGFLGPSIHASADKVTREGKNYVVEGLSIDGIGLVAFQGVKAATIDYAIAESFDKKESSEEDANNKDKEADNMSEEETPKVEEPKVEAPAEPAAEPAKEEPKEEEKKEDAPAEEPKEDSKVAALEKEVAALKEAKKVDLVESIIKINPKLEKEALMKESEERLDLMRSYETKLVGQVSTAIVETDAKEDKGDVIEKDGDLTMSEKMYKEFNAELRERVR